MSYSTDQISQALARTGLSKVQHGMAMRNIHAMTPAVPGHRGYVLLGIMPYTIYMRPHDGKPEVLLVNGTDAEPTTENVSALIRIGTLAGLDALETQLRAARVLLEAEVATPEPAEEVQHHGV